MRQFLAEQEAQRQFETWVVGLFSAVALGLAALGVLAVMHFNVAEDARAVDILHLVIGGGNKLTILGIAAGKFASIWPCAPRTLIRFQHCAASNEFATCGLTS